MNIHLSPRSCQQLSPAPLNAQPQRKMSTLVKVALTSIALVGVTLLALSLAVPPLLFVGVPLLALSLVAGGCYHRIHLIRRFAPGHLPHHQIHATQFIAPSGQEIPGLRREAVPVHTRTFVTHDNVLPGRRFVQEMPQNRPMPAQLRPQVSPTVAVPVITPVRPIHQVPVLSRPVQRPQVTPAVAVPVITPVRSAPVVQNLSVPVRNRPLQRAPVAQVVAVPVVAPSGNVVAGTRSTAVNRAAPQQRPQATPLITPSGRVAAGTRR